MKEISGLVIEDLKPKTDLINSMVSYTLPSQIAALSGMIKNEVLKQCTPSFMFNNTICPIAENPTHSSYVEEVSVASVSMCTGSNKKLVVTDNISFVEYPSFVPGSTKPGGCVRLPSFSLGSDLFAYAHAITQDDCTSSTTPDHYFSIGRIADHGTDVPIFETLTEWFMDDKMNRRACTVTAVKRGAWMGCSILTGSFDDEIKSHDINRVSISYMDVYGRRKEWIYAGSEIRTDRAWGSVFFSIGSGILIRDTVYFLVWGSLVYDMSGEAFCYAPGCTSPTQFTCNYASRPSEWGGQQIVNGILHFQDNTNDKPTLHLRTFSVTNNWLGSEGRLFYFEEVDKVYIYTRSSTWHSLPQTGLVTLGWPLNIQWIQQEAVSRPGQPPCGASNRCPHQCVTGVYTDLFPIAEDYEYTVTAYLDSESSREKPTIAVTGVKNMIYKRLVTTPSQGADYTTTTCFVFKLRIWCVSIIEMSPGTITARQPIPFLYHLNLGCHDTSNNHISPLQSSVGEYQTSKPVGGEIGCHFELYEGKVYFLLSLPNTTLAYLVQGQTAPDVVGYNLTLRRLCTSVYTEYINQVERGLPKFNIKADGWFFIPTNLSDGMIIPLSKNKSENKGQSGSGPEDPEITGHHKDTNLGKDTTNLTQIGSTLKFTVKPPYTSPMWPTTNDPKLESTISPLSEAHTGTSEGLGEYSPLSTPGRISQPITTDTGLTERNKETTQSDRTDYRGYGGDEGQITRSQEKILGTTNVSDTVHEKHGRSSLSSSPTYTQVISTISPETNGISHKSENNIEITAVGDASKISRTTTDRVTTGDKATIQPNYSLPQTGFFSVKTKPPINPTEDYQDTTIEFPHTSNHTPHEKTQSQFHSPVTSSKEEIAPTHTTPHSVDTDESPRQQGGPKPSPAPNKTTSDQTPALTTKTTKPHRCTGNTNPPNPAPARAPENALKTTNKVDSQLSHKAATTTLPPTHPRPNQDEKLGKSNGGKTSLNHNKRAGTSATPVTKVTEKTGKFKAGQHSKGQEARISQVTLKITHKSPLTPPAKVELEKQKSKPSVNSRTATATTPDKPQIQNKPASGKHFHKPPTQTQELSKDHPNPEKNKAPSSVEAQPLEIPVKMTDDISGLLRVASQIDAAPQTDVKSTDTNPELQGSTNIMLALFKAMNSSLDNYKVDYGVRARRDSAEDLSTGAPSGQIPGTPQDDKAMKPPILKPIEPSKTDGYSFEYLSSGDNPDWNDYGSGGEYEKPIDLPKSYQPEFSLPEIYINGELGDYEELGSLGECLPSSPRSGSACLNRIATVDVENDFSELKSIREINDIISKRYVDNAKISAKQYTENEEASLPESYLQGVMCAYCDRVSTPGFRENHILHEIAPVITNDGILLGNTPVSHLIAEYTAGEYIDFVPNRNMSTYWDYTKLTINYSDPRRNGATYPITLSEIMLWVNDAYKRIRDGSCYSVVLKGYPFIVHRRGQYLLMYGIKRSQEWEGFSWEDVVPASCFCKQMKAATKDELVYQEKVMICKQYEIYMLQQSDLTLVRGFSEGNLEWNKDNREEKSSDAKSDPDVFDAPASQKTDTPKEDRVEDKTFLRGYFGSWW
uniref:Hemagglutinin-neuraminidase n=1 Tax=Mus rat paramyxovirus TaxID=3141895 RepID=A0AAU7E2E2_9MONO